MKQSWDSSWDEIFKNREWGKYPEGELICFIAHNFYKAPDRSKVKILDVGCGTGAQSWFIAREGFDSYAIDGSISAIDKLKARFKNDGLSCNTLVGDVINLPYENEYFDGVIEAGCLCCNELNELQGIINEIYRTLKPNGKFYSQLFGPKTLGYGLGSPVAPDTFTDIPIGPLAQVGRVHFSSLKEIKELFSNFKELNIKRIETSIENSNQCFMEQFIIHATK